MSNHTPLAGSIQAKLGYWSNPRSMEFAAKNTPSLVMPPTCSCGFRFFVYVGIVVRAAEFELSCSRRSERSESPRNKQYLQIPRPRHNRRRPTDHLLACL